MEMAGELVEKKKRVVELEEKAAVDAEHLAKLEEQVKMQAIKVSQKNVSLAGLQVAPQKKHL
jgi:uncharacterized coiled-coil protein SlyX